MATKLRITSIAGCPVDIVVAVPDQRLGETAEEWARRVVGFDWAPPERYAAEIGLVELSDAD